MKARLWGELVTVYPEDVCIASDLYTAGIQDDGHPYIAERFHVSITTPEGYRFRSRAFWLSAAQCFDEEGGLHFANVRHEAESQAQAACDAVLASGLADLDLGDWTEERPAYGSEAYQAQEMWDTNDGGIWQ